MAKQTTTLSDTFTLKGRWWLPETPDTAVPGSLTFSPDGPREIALDGTLRDIPKGDWKGYSAKVIHGHTLDGKLCTAVDTFEKGCQFFSPGSASSEFFFNKLLIGREHVDPDQTTFESAVVDLTDLGGWLHRDPFKDEHNQKQGISTTRYTMPKLISVRIPSIKATLSFEAGMNANMEYQKRTLRHRDTLRIRPRRKQKLDWYLDVIFKFRILLSLLVGRPVAVNSIRLCTKPRKIPQLGPKPYREYLDLCLRVSGKKVEKELLPPEIPFTYPVLRKQLCPILATWFDKSEKLSTLSGLHFGVQVNDATPGEFRFLALIQAIESFHRFAGRDKYVSDAKYKPTKDAIIAAIPAGLSSDHRDALKSRIRFGNEYSLRKRLTLTIKRLPKKLHDVITYGNTNFITEVVATRNYLTHRDESQRQNVLDFKGTFNASESLRLVITFLLLNEAGVPASLVESVMLTHWTFGNRNRIL
ncbi:MAG: hypothetical protein JXQ75_15250 [Phycisphaerae bacterium]|nr:hypothetical protein [Phycisphaerae bacterium]